VHAMSRDYFTSLNNSINKSFFSKLKFYVYVYCEIDEDNRRIPIYIGKGIRDRCLSHLDDLDKNNDSKSNRIKNLLNENKLDIDIIGYGLDEKTALAIESACIDLMGLGNLANKVRGQGKSIKRIPISELSSKLSTKTVQVAPEHKGVVILINKDYKPTFGDLELFEITRGMWRKGSMTIAGDSKYAFAENNGVTKEVYEIYCWVPAGTQQYFTRQNDPEWMKDRWEFVGKKANNEIRELYIGQRIERPRSFGNPFVKLGI